MTVATSRSHLAQRVDRYVKSVSSLSGEPLSETLEHMFGAASQKFIIGGLVRDLARGGIASRHFDVDVVLDLESVEVLKIACRENAKPNRFGGFGTVKRGWKIDFWALSTTWAHQAGYAKLNYPSDIIDTTFFNVDAILFNLRNSQVVMEDDYLKDIESRILEINLEENPSIEGNLVRAVRRLKMWNYRCGPRLARFLHKNIDQEMFHRIICVEQKLYGKSYAKQFVDHRELLVELTDYVPGDIRQLEFGL